MKCAIILVRFQRFDEGTLSLVLGKPKFVVLADVVHTFCKMKNKQISQPGFQFQR